MVTSLAGGTLGVEKCREAWDLLRLGAATSTEVRSEVEGAR
jgi:hypothetical protein